MVRVQYRAVLSYVQDTVCKEKVQTSHDTTGDIIDKNELQVARHSRQRRNVFSVLTENKSIHSKLTTHISSDRSFRIWSVALIAIPIRKWWN